MTCVSCGFYVQDNVQVCQSCGELVQKKPLSPVIPVNASVEKANKPVLEVDEASKIRQQIYDIQNAVNIAKNAGKKRIALGIFYLVVDIFLILLYLSSPTAWYYWLYIIICVVLNIRAFLKGNTLLAQAKAGEQQIYELERKQRSYNL